MLFLLEERGSVVPGPAPCEPKTPGPPWLWRRPSHRPGPQRVEALIRGMLGSIKEQMSVVNVLSRIAQIEALTTPAAPPTPPAVATPPPARATSFAAALAGASNPSTGTGSAAGARALAAAQSQVGQAEQPPGS